MLGKGFAFIWAGILALAIAFGVAFGGVSLKDLGGGGGSSGSSSSSSSSTSSSSSSSSSSSPAP